MLDHKEPRITLLWVPSHKEIPGNKKDNQAAKEALDEDISTTGRYPPDDLKKWLTSKKETKDGKMEKTR
jgi:ribonuclease HI